MMRRSILNTWWCLALLLPALGVPAQEMRYGPEDAADEAWPAATATSAVAAAAASGVEVSAAALSPGEIDVKADELIYDRAGGWIEAHGNAVIRNGADTLTADYVHINLATEEAMAYGNVVLDRPSGATHGERLSYNFKTDRGHADYLAGEAKPFYWVAEETEQVSTNRFVLHQAQVTTCRYSGTHRHYHVRARKLTIAPYEWIKARHAVWFFGRVPAFYSPYWFRSLKESGCGWSLQPGYESELGMFLFATYSCSLWPWLKTETHFDYYTRRGLGLGQDFRWHQPDTAWSGDLELYYIDDKRPWEPEEDPALSLVDNQRHRIRLRHRYYPSRWNYFLMQAYHLSDPDVREDFFENEHKRSSQPENYMTYTHRSEGYLVNLNLRQRFNRFYTTLERLPEVSGTIFRRELGDSRFYYEGRAVAAHLNLAFPDDSSFDDVDLLRGDTYHRFYRPFRLFRFLNMVPRAGYRLTWYSETKDYANVVVENVLSDGTTETVTVEEEVVGAAGTRSLYEVGHKISFKAFRVWNNVGTAQRSYRHIVEPYADYTYVTQSGLHPGAIYRLDSVDGADEAHYALLGLRNMLQTKDGDRGRDIVDLDIYTVYELDRDEGDEPIDEVRIDAEIAPMQRMRIDVDAEYDVPADEFSRIDTRLWVWKKRVWSLSVENRFRQDSSDRWEVEGDWRPNDGWRFGSYVRYDVEDSEMESAGGYIQRDLDCIGLKAGGRYRPGYALADGTAEEDEYRITFEFWLKAFPSTRMKIR